MLLTPLAVLTAALLAPAAQQSPWSDPSPLDGRVTNVQSLDAADLDGDGHRDLVMMGTSPLRVAVARGEGGGEFALPHVEAIASNALELGGDLGTVRKLFEDFNGDGALDLFVSYGRFSTGPAELWWTAGDGQGGFGAFELLATIPTVIFQIDAADLNGDGISDVLIAGYDGFLTYLTSSPSGPGTTPRHLVAGAFGSPIVAAGDFDGDGFVDLFVRIRPDGTATPGTQVIFGNGALPFTQSAAVPLDFLPQSVIVHDLDADGDLDLVASGANGAVTQLVENLGSRTFGPVRLLTGPTLGGAHQVVDLDGDGLPDLLSPAWLTGYRESRNLGGMNFGVPTQVNSQHSFASVAWDFSGDGIADAVAFDSVEPDYRQLLRVVGSTNLVLKLLALHSSQLPAHSFGLFLCSRTAASIPNIPGSVGTLCVGNPVGRFSLPSEIQHSGASGAFTLAVDVTSIPTPNLGRIAIQPGDTWVFQAWHRDSATGGGVVSNFTQAIQVMY